MSPEQFHISIEPPNFYVNGHLIGYIRRNSMQLGYQDANIFCFETSRGLYGSSGETSRCFRTLDLSVEKIKDTLPAPVHQLLYPPDIRSRPPGHEQALLNLNI